MLEKLINYQFRIMSFWKEYSSTSSKTSINCIKSTEEKKNKTNCFTDERGKTLAVVRPWFLLRPEHSFLIYFHHPIYLVFSISPGKSLADAWQAKSFILTMIISVKCHGLFLYILYVSVNGAIKETYIAPSTEITTANLM